MTKTVFQNVLADDWSLLGSVIKRHYFLRPHSDDYICVSGVMSRIHHSWFAKIFLPFGVLFGAVVPFRASNVPVDVHYNCCKENANIYWDRVFKLSEKNHYHFKSHMEHISGNEVIEFVRFGVGMRLKVTAEDGAIVFRDKGYIWRIFGMHIPIPVALFFGNAYVEERPLDENNFSMKMVLNHSVFGILFSYEGKFCLEEDLHNKRMQSDAAEPRR